jgi:hypothetical protein
MSEAVLIPTEAERPVRSRAAARHAWAERLARFDAATQTVAQFCAAEAVSVASFYLWKRRLAAAAAGDAPRVLPVRLAPSAAPVELVLPSGAVLRIGPGCDLAFVRSLLAALGGASC